MNFGGGGSTQPPVTTSTTSSSPWSGVQPFLTSLYGQAQNLQQANVGAPYQGEMVAPLNSWVNEALGNTVGTSANLNTVLPSQIQAGLGTLGGLGASYGMTPQIQQVLAGLGTTAGQYGQIYGQAQGAANPYLQATIDAQNQRGNAAIQSAMSGAGRYGSGQMQDVMARAQAQVADPLLMQDYEARQARALQASQGLGQTYGQQAGIMQQGIGQGIQAYNMMPNFAQGAYVPSQMELAAGQYQQNFTQQQLQGAIQQFQANAMFPWEQLQRESALLSGAGSLGGTTVQAQTPLQASLAQRLAGGALVGAGLGSAIPGLGTGLGAGAGALAGAFL
jgi:hypothetical protein